MANDGGASKAARALPPATSLGGRAHAGVDVGGALLGLYGRGAALVLVPWAALFVDALRLIPSFFPDFALGGAFGIRAILARHATIERLESLVKRVAPTRFRHGPTLPLFFA